MKLIKTTKGHYILIDDTKETNDKDFIVGTSRDTNASKLSIKNCESIERGYDLDELAKEYWVDEYYNSHGSVLEMNDFKEGFKKALSILGDKKFNQNDVLDVVNHVLHEMVLVEGFDKQYLFPESVYHEVTTKCKSIQQNEWDVFIDKREVITGVVTDRPGYNYTSYFEPRLDSDGCLILKKK